MKRHTLLSGAFSLLAFAYAGLLTLQVAVPGLGDSLGAMIIYTKPQPVWATISSRLVASGATVPANTNVIFHLPYVMQPIDREVLLGHKGATVRYWGYCYPEPGDPQNLRQSNGLPGKFFLSEAERAWRAAQQAANKPTYSLLNPPRPRDVVQQPGSAAPPLIRHQIDTFTAGMTCYIMTEQPLPIGTDTDGDGLNIKQEHDYGTDPNNPDTDGDGLPDGLEVLTGTNPLSRDTDGDGIVDGIEDKNHNGKVDPGETDPRNKDSDGDGLCDGYCRVNNDKRICNDYQGTQCIDLPYGRWEGEDKNLNGVVDQGETDPTKWSTAGDGISDEERLYECYLNGASC